MDSRSYEVDFHNLTIACHQKSTFCLCAAGAEGSVFRGRWHHIDVAVKEMHPQSSSFSRLASIAQDLTHTGQSTVLEGIMKEVQALIDVSQHPNIVRFIGEGER